MLRRRRALSLLLVLLLVGLARAAAPPRNDGTSWPTLHGDLRRAGWYPRFPTRGLKLVWRCELWREMTGPRAEVIVGGGLAFLGTYAGRLHAYDALTGEPRWEFVAGGPIGHSPMLVGDTLYVGAADGGLHALAVADGQPRWSQQLEAGIWSSPVVHDGLVVVGLRNGAVIARRAADGAAVWRYQAGGPILGVPSLDDSGTLLLVPSEDMHVHALDLASGAPRWRSAPLAGLSLRDYAPAVVGGLALLSSNPVRDFHATLDSEQAMLLQGAGASGPETRFVPGGPAEVTAEQERIVAWLRAHPGEQTFHALRLTDGSEPWVAPVFYHGGLHNPTSPPCYDPTTGEVFVWLRSAYTVWDGGGEVRPYTAVGRLDLATGRVPLISHSHASRQPGRAPGRPDMPWNSFPTIGDETQTLACAPGLLLSCHQGSLGALDLATGLTASLAGQRDSYAGFYGPANFGWEQDGGYAKARAAGQPYGLVNEWHGPARAIPAVVGDRVYLNVGSQLICLQGSLP